MVTHGVHLEPPLNLVFERDENPHIFLLFMYNNVNHNFAQNLQNLVL